MSRKIALILTASVLSLGGCATMDVPARTSSAEMPFVGEGNVLFMVYANPVDGKDDEFNAWYDRHMGGIAKLPEFVKAQRLIVQPRAGRENPPYKYLIAYEVAGRDIDAATAAIGAAVTAGNIESPDMNLVLKLESMAYRPITPVMN